MANRSNFEEPEKFKPERFLDAKGNHVTIRPPGMINFGLGRRVCLGEKMDNVDVFYVIVRVLQATKGYEFTLPDGPGCADLMPDPTIGTLVAPMPYKLKLVPKK